MSWNHINLSNQLLEGCVHCLKGENVKMLGIEINNELATPYSGMISITDNYKKQDFSWFCIAEFPKLSLKLLSSDYPIDYGPQYSNVTSKYTIACTFTVDKLRGVTVFSSRAFTGTFEM